MLVPDIASQPPGTEERIPTPGAATSGLRRSEIVVGPAEENPATVEGVVSVTAATVIAPSALPGEVTDP